MTTPASCEFPPSRIRLVARKKVPGGIVGICLKQKWTELALSCRSIRFRRNENAEATSAYCAMTEAEFEGINARQQWANWRTIPRNLHGRLPSRPCRAVDLCSGLGHSTRVLAYYLPPGSEILGLEYNPRFVGAALQKDYLGADGRHADVSFRAQSVLETFRDVRGEPLADESVDLVNSCGSLGLHFGAADVERLAGEIFRVLKPGGLATVDSSSQGVDRARMTEIFEKQGFLTISSAKSCLFDRFTQICFRKEDELAL